MYFEVLRWWEKIKVLWHQILKDDVFIWEYKKEEFKKNYTREELENIKWPDLKKIYAKNVWTISVWLSKKIVIETLLNNK